MFYSWFKPGVEEDGGEESVELVWSVGICERQHSTNVLHAVHLRTQRRLLVVEAASKLAVLGRGEDALAFDADAAGSSEQLATHVDVVGGDVRVDELLADLRKDAIIKL